MAGSRNTHVATLVERSSRFVRLVRVGGKDTESVVTALGEQARRLPKTMMATLTWDRGPEMAAHAAHKRHRGERRGPRRYRHHSPIQVGSIITGI